MIRTSYIIPVLSALFIASPSFAAQPVFTPLTKDGRLKQRPQWSPDGTTLVFARHSGAKIQLVLLDVKSGKERRLTKGDNPEYDAVWSPDGKRLAFAFDKTSPNQGDIDVHLIDADGKNQKPLAVSQGKLSHEESPAWSPDGKRVAYSSTRDGNQELYVIGIDGKNAKRLTNDPAIDAHPAWSPDGKRLAFATNRWGDLEIAVLELSTSTVTRLTHNKGLDDYPAWSPDGKHIAWTSSRRGNFEIFVMHADGTNQRNATDNPAIDNFPAWTPDGRLTFVSNRSGGFEVYVERK
jgi:TolB protein